MKFLILCVSFLLVYSPARAVDYYLSNAGDDANNGITFDAYGTGSGG